jgi:hypothetical protein
MILTLAVVLGLIASLARHRGRFVRQLEAIRLHSAWLVVLALCLQFPLLRAPLLPARQVGWQQILFLLSPLLLLVFVWRNRQLAGIPIVGFGVLSNLLVILANGGFMPITPQTLIQINPGTTLDQWPSGFHYGFSKDVILAREQVNLWLLSDMLVIPPPFPWPTAFSLGDLLIAVGIVVLLQGPGPAARSIAGGLAPGSENRKGASLDETQEP